MRRIDLKRAQGARPNTIRDINRQIVLNYVREREPISRAEIARETNLQRSTISRIVQQLTGDGLVEEIGAGESTGGRRPTMLRLRAASAVAVGVDIALSRTVVATSDLAGRVLEQEEFATEPDAKRMINQVIERVRHLATKSGGAVESVGMTLPGLVNPAAGEVIYIPYFKWRALPLKSALQAATNLDVKIDNDANAVALAELWFGRPEVSDARDFILVLVTEGVGTGIVFDGQIYRGERGAAGEFGHMIVGTDAPIICSCGKRNCWEAFTSERATVARYLKLKRSSGSRVSFADVIERALDNEKAATRALAETARYIGIGLSNLMAGFSPEAVVVCGNITQAWHLVACGIQQAVEENLRHGVPPAPIIPSTLGEQPKLMGALSLVLASKFASASVA